MRDFKDEFKFYLKLERGVSENTVSRYAYDLEKLEQFSGTER